MYTGSGLNAGQQWQLDFASPESFQSKTRLRAAHACHASERITLCAGEQPAEGILLTADGFVDPNRLPFVFVSRFGWQ